jgi:hypothetical protein
MLDSSEWFVDVGKAMRPSKTERGHLGLRLGARPVAPLCGDMALTSDAARLQAMNKLFDQIHAVAARGDVQCALELEPRQPDDPVPSQWNGSGDMRDTPHADPKSDAQGNIALMRRRVGRRFGDVQGDSMNGTAQRIAPGIIDCNGPRGMPTETYRLRLLGLG